MHWLELTSVSDGETVYVNMDQVVRISEYKWQHGVGSTLLTLSVNKDGGGLSIDVREAPSEILRPAARRQHSPVKGPLPGRGAKEGPVEEEMPKGESPRRRGQRGSSKSARGYPGDKGRSTRTIEGEQTERGKKDPPAATNRDNPDT
jgi:hypothetical protein